MKNQDLHVWFFDNIEAYLTDGLETRERFEFESHRKECAACAAAFEHAQYEDKGLRELFVDAQPDPGLEDRMVRGLYEIKSSSSFRRSTGYKIAAGMAAVFVLGGVGFIANSQVRDGRMRLPDLALFQAKQDRHEAAESNEVANRVSGQLGASDSGMWDVAKLDQNDGYGQALGRNLSLSVSAAGAVDSVEMNIPQINYMQATSEEVAFADALTAQEKAASGIYRGPSDTLAPSQGEQKDQIRDEVYSYKNDAPVQPEKKVSLGQEFSLGVATLTAAKQPVTQNLSVLRVSVDKDPGQAPETKPGNPEKIPSKIEEPHQAQRKVIRNADMEFEVDSFDAAFMQITKIVMEEGGFVSSTNSEKLTNGKVRGTVVVRVNPDRLDLLVLKLRALGDLKTQRIAAQDITKAYTDLESQLRAGRAMESRLLEIIKSGKGEIKDLLAAEKELGVWREKIEKVEGELRYYNNLVSLSTLNITLQEKEIKAPSSATETERVSMGIEVEDVEKIYAEVLKAVSELKGRVTKSDLKKFDAGQFNAQIECEISPENAGVLQDRLKQLGNVARLDIGRSQTTQGGVGRPTGIPIERKETQFAISLYNLANVAARETTYVDLACSNVEEAFKALLERIEQSKGRVLSSNVNRQKAGQTTGTINFEAVTSEAEALLSDIRLRGETLKFNIVENLEGNTTRSKRGFLVQLFSQSMIAPRESQYVRVAVKDVSSTYHKLLAELQKLKCRIISSNLAEEDKNNVTGMLDFEVSKVDQAAIEALISGSGDTFTRRMTRVAESETAIDSKVRLQCSLMNAANLSPRETTTVGLEVNEVEDVIEELQAMVTKQGGRVVESHLSREKNGRIVGKLVVDVPLSSGATLLEKAKKSGTVRMIQSSKNSQVPDGALARARFDLTVANGQFIVPSDRGVGPTIRDGLANSFAGLMWSLNLIVIGLCFVGPWILILFLIWKIVRRKKAKAD